MKPAPFDYVAPTTVDEAVAALHEHGDDAKVLAGGQSLVPAMNLRLARPEVLVDINRIGTLGGVRTTDRELVVGALARHADVAGAPVPGPLGRLVRAASAHVGHLPVRLRGTFCGSLAHADPAAEWCAVLAAVDGVAVARSQAGERHIPAGELFDGIFSTTLREDELLTEARLPLLGPGWRVGVREVSRRAGDFALALVVALVDVDVGVADGHGDGAGHGEGHGDGRGIVRAARLVAGGVADRPLRLADAEQALVGRPVDRATLADVAHAAAGAVPFDDDDGPHRRNLVGVLAARAVEGAR